MNELHNKKIYRKFYQKQMQKTNQKWEGFLNGKVKIIFSAVVFIRKIQYKSRINIFLNRAKFLKLFRNTFLTMKQNQIKKMQ